MKPEQFIREFGVGKAREVVEGAPLGSVHFSYEDDEIVYLKDDAYFDNDYEDWFEVYFMMPELISLSDLKRLVESLDIINDLGGIEKLTPNFITTDKHLGYTHVRMVGNGRLSFLDDFCDFIPDDTFQLNV